MTVRSYAIYTAAVNRKVNIHRKGFYLRRYSILLDLKLSRRELGTDFWSQYCAATTSIWAQGLTRRDAWFHNHFLNSVIKCQLNE